MKALAQGHTAVKVEELGFELLLRSYDEFSSGVRKYLRVWEALQCSFSQGTLAMSGDIFYGHNWW